jgi:nicotinamidase/pyrazinamidase
MAMRIEPERDALIVVDLQPDFMPGGALAVGEGDRVVAPIAALAARFDTVVATQDWHPRGHVSFASTHGRPPFTPLPLYGAEQMLWPDHCVAGTPGAALHAGLPQSLVTSIIRKGSRRAVDSYSAFRENVGPDGARLPTGLAGYLRERGIARVFVCGLARDYCVRASAIDAAAAGFATWLVDDLTRAVDRGSRARVDAELHVAGVAIIASGELSDGARRSDGDRGGARP